MKGLVYVKIALRSSANLNIGNDDKYCFLWSKVADLHPSNNYHPNRVSNYKQSFNELNIQGFDFTDGFRCSDDHKFEKLTNLSMNIFELKFYQDQNKWRHKLIPIEVSKNDSSRDIDLIIYRNHYALTKKLNFFLGDHHKNFICRRCLNWKLSEDMLVLHKQNCGEDDICSIRTSNDTQIQWIKHFHKNSFYLRIIADFEADNELEKSSIGEKTTNIFKQKPISNGYNIVYELDDILESVYYKSPLGYDNVDLFINENNNLEIKMAIYF